MPNSTSSNGSQSSSSNSSSNLCPSPIAIRLSSALYDRDNCEQYLKPLNLAPQHFQLLYGWDKWFDQAMNDAIQAQDQAMQRRLMRELSVRHNLESE